MDANLIKRVLSLIKLRKTNPIIVKINRLGDIYKYKYYIIKIFACVLMKMPISLNG